MKIDYINQLNCFINRRQNQFTQYHFRVESEDDDENPGPRDEIDVHFYVTVPKEFISLLKDYDLAVLLGCENWNPDMVHALKSVRYFYEFLYYTY